MLPLPVTDSDAETKQGTAAVVQIGGHNANGKKERNSSGLRPNGGPQRSSFEPKAGDWTCVVCKSPNYASRTECFRRGCSGKRSDAGVEVFARAPLSSGAGLGAQGAQGEPTKAFAAIGAPPGLYSGPAVAATQAPATQNAGSALVNPSGTVATVTQVVGGGANNNAKQTVSWADLTEEEERKAGGGGPLRTVFVAMRANQAPEGFCKVIQVDRSCEPKWEAEDDGELTAAGQANVAERLAHQHVPIGFEPKAGAVVIAPPSAGPRVADSVAQVLRSLVGHVKALVSGVERIDARVADLAKSLVTNVSLSEDERMANAMVAMALEMEEEDDVTALKVGTANMSQVLNPPLRWPPTPIGRGPLPPRLITLLDRDTDVQAAAYVNATVETGLTLYCGGKVVLPSRLNNSGEVIQDDGASQVTASEAVARALGLVIVETKVRMLAAGGHESDVAGVARANAEGDPLYVVRCMHTPQSTWTAVEMHVLRGNDGVILIGGLEPHLHNVQVDYANQVVKYEPFFCRTAGRDTSAHTMPMRSITPGPQAQRLLHMKEVSLAAFC